MTFDRIISEIGRSGLVIKVLLCSKEITRGNKRLKKNWLKNCNNVDTYIPLFPQYTSTCTTGHTGRSTHYTRIVKVMYAFVLILHMLRVLIGWESLLMVTHGDTSDKSDNYFV